MTSHELARKLLEMDDLPVTVSGYEGGVDFIKGIAKPQDLKLDVHDAWYYGKHEYVYDDKENTTAFKVIKAIHVGEKE